VVREEGEGGGGLRCVAPRGRRRKGVPVPHSLEQGEGLGADSGRSRWRRATVGETGEGAQWWGSGVARGPEKEMGSALEE
jgi:hypothetical protein